MIKEIYQAMKEYFTLQIVDVAMKQEISPIHKNALEKSNIQLVKKRNYCKRALENSNYNLIKKKEGNL